MKQAIGFFAYFGCIDSSYVSKKRKQTIIEAQSVVIKKNNNFRFIRDLKSFEKLIPGEVFARSSSTKYVAGVDEYIIFPRPNAPLGAEVFIIGKKVH